METMNPEQCIFCEQSVNNHKISCPNSPDRVNNLIRERTMCKIESILLNMEKLSLEDRKSFLAYSLDLAREQGYTQGYRAALRLQKRLNEIRENNDKAN
jgi:hypothetical protein